MPLVDCAHRTSLQDDFSFGLQLEDLECRRLLTGPPSAVAEAITAMEISVVQISEPDSTVANDVQIVAPPPLIPFADHVAPMVDCPGVDSRLCFPREIASAPNTKVDKPTTVNAKPTDFAFRLLIWGSEGPAQHDPRVDN